MTSDEKLKVLRLLVAIDKASEPIQFTLGLPPGRGEYEAQLATVDRERDKRNAALEAAKAVIKQMIDEE